MTATLTFGGGRALGEAAGGGFPASATQIARQIRGKQISAVEAVRQCLARIDEVNLRINAVVAFCRERAFAEAAHADELLARGTVKGVLHGVPFTASDCLDAAGLVSTAGTLGRKQHVPGADAAVIARARDQGAILLGKSNASELSLAGGGRSTANLVYGVTRNPYDPSRSSGAQSGGAAAIVAGGGAYFDFGCDLAGGIREPASMNGIAGFKPTFGRLPRTGHVIGYGGAFDSFLEIGLMARRAEDLALLTPVLCGPDAWDASIAPVPLGDPGQVELQDLRVACYTTLPQQEAAAEIQSLVKECAGFFKALGCKVTEDEPPRMADLAQARRRFLGADGREHVRQLLKRHGTSQASPDLLLDGEVITSAEFSKLCEDIDAIKSEQLAWFSNYDLVIGPASSRAAARVDETAPDDGEYRIGGWPAGILRCGTSAGAAGMPLCIQVMAQPWRDDVVLAALAWIERYTGGWLPSPA